MGKLLDNIIKVQPRQASGRTTLCWSTELMQVAEMQADIGQLRLAADLCEAMLGDDRVQQSLRTRVQGLLGLTPTFEASSGDGRRRGRVGKALEQGEDWWALCPVDESALFLSWGFFLGLALGRLEWWDESPWKNVPGLPGTQIQDKPKARMREGRLVPTIKFWHPRCLRWDAQVNAWFARTADGSEQLVTPGRNGWLLFTPYGTTRPWSTAPWRAVKNWWLPKHRAIEDWSRHTERGAQIFLESAEGANPGERETIGQDMAGAGSDAVTVAPFGYRANMLESQSGGDLYEKLIVRADTATTTAILGHANNAEAKGASTGSNAGQNILYMIASGDAEGWGGFAHDQVLEPYSEVNFGDRELAQFPIYPLKKPDELAQRGAGLKAIGEGVTALEAANDAVDGRKILESAGVPMLSDAELAKKRADAQARAAALPAATTTSAGDKPADTKADASADEKNDDDDAG